MMPTRILVCGSDALFNAGLRALLETQPDLVVLGEVVGDERTLAAVRELSPDVVILSRDLPPPHVVRELAESVRLVMFTDDDGSGCAMGRLAMGARAVLRERTTPEELLGAIRMVATGEFLVVPLAVKHHLGPVAPGEPAAPAPLLTSREREVLQLLVHGLSNTEIAAKLCVSTTTVRSHVHHMLGKLDVQSRAQAVAVAYRTGLIETVRSATA
jgi:DNA-binding NarL/FixJ family response regulator